MPVKVAQAEILVNKYRHNQVNFFKQLLIETKKFETFAINH